MIGAVQYFEYKLDILDMWTPLHKAKFFSRLSMNSDKSDGFLGYDFLLKKPVTTKLDNENVFSYSSLEIGHSSMQGYRKSMEDMHIIKDFPTAKDHTLVAVMDGHSGKGASILTSRRLIHVIEKTDHWKKYIKRGRLSTDSELVSLALIQAFIDMDKELRESPVTNGSGCTCVCAVIAPETIICASVGDSRCVIGTKNNVISMSEDHKPSLPEEKARIANAGGFVQFDRVNGELAMSRALGDFQYKSNPTLADAEQLVICIPDVSVHKRNSDDEILVLACDGVWDVMSNADAIAFLSNLSENFGGAPSDSSSKNAVKKLKTEFKSVELSTDKNDLGDTLTSENMAEALIEMSLVSGSTDNLSCIVVKLKK